MARANAGWSALETEKIDQLLQKEAKSGPMDKEKWQLKFPSKTISSIMAKRRHRISQLQALGKLPANFQQEVPKEKDREKDLTRNRRSLFNELFGGPSSDQQYEKPSETACEEEGVNTHLA